MRTRNHRPGFTLVEMLVALAIILALAAMLVLASLRMSDKNQVPKAANIVQGMLAQAKTRALAGKKAVGVRFLVSPQNPAGFPPRPNPPASPTGMVTVELLQYIHDPGDFADGWITSDVDPSTPADEQIHPDTGMPVLPGDPLFGRLVYGPPRAPVSQEPYTGFSFGDEPPATVIGGGAVLPGDSIEFHGGGQAARVELDPAVLSTLGVRQSIYHPLQTAGTLNRTVLVLDRPLDRSIQPTVPPVGALLPPMVPTSAPRANYRIMRQPRPIPGEAPVSLPREVAIIGRDLTGYFFNPTDLPVTSRRPRQSMPAFTSNAEIMFAPSGQVMWSNSEALFLFLSDSPSAQLDPNTGEPYDTNWAIVAVYTRTGGVAVYPVNQFVGPGGNPYLFAQLGRGTGM